jgi:CubicO group peptidase (beta-lactamase class C family)
MRSFKYSLLVMVIGLFCGLLAQAQTQTPVFPDAAASDPKTLGWMQGFPPASDKTIRFDNGSFYRFPAFRWSFSNVRELVPTKNVWRGDGPVVPLPRAERNLDGVPFTDMTGKPMTWGQSLTLNYTDGILVMHKGKTVYEKYFGVLEPQKPHQAFSVTKSFVGTLASLLVEEDKLDPAALVTKYIPELKGTAYDDATVRQVMDMTVGVQYSENYADPKAEVWDYARAGGMLPAGPNYQGPKTYYEFLVKLKKEGNHDEAFGYKTVNAEILAWIVKRVSGKSLAALLSDTIWSKLGAEYDAYFWVDSVSSESGGGGLNTALRDLARFGEMIRLNGRYNGQQIIPAAVVEDIRRGGNKAYFAKAGYATLPGWSYRNMWWVSHNEHGAFMARGIHGQNIYIDPKAGMVIVRYASFPIAGNAANDPFTLPAYMAIAKYLMQK